jgi:hypothetical protein
MSRGAGGVGLRGRRSGRRAGAGPPAGLLPGAGASGQRVCVSADALNMLLRVAEDSADTAEAKFLMARQRILGDAQMFAMPALPQGTPPSPGTPPTGGAAGR